MFSHLGLFKEIDCPIDDECELPNCIFHHTETQATRAWRHASNDEDAFQSQPRKRPRLDGSPAPEVVSARHRTVPFVGRLTRNLPSARKGLDEGEVDGEQEQNIVSDKEVLIESRSRSTSISPPPVRRPVSLHAPLPKAKITSVSNHLSRSPDTVVEPQTIETLNPRALPKPPAAHTSRVLYLKKLHEFMVRLNDLAGQSPDPAVRSLKLDRNRLIKLALDEEMRIALESPTVYGNMIKLRMVALSKMNLEQWKLELLQSQVKSEGTVNASKELAARDLATGLSTVEELQILPHLFANQSVLEHHGLVTSPPTESEIDAAREGTALSKGYEECDRCGCRFQVFPERREDGALTSGGACAYHHGRLRYPDHDHPRAAASTHEKRYTCCNEPIGSSKGCTSSDTHVFKVSDPKRLASILQYQPTPENPHARTDRAICFDCEMGYTVKGMEIIRLTVTSWPTGEELVDVLVRPLGTVLDLNSRYSGVTIEEFSNARSYKTSLPAKAFSEKAVSHPDNRMLIVDSPAAARDLLFELLSPSTPLIGHAIENDLNVTRIVHPSIIDTAILFPHRAGLPFRRALRMLTKEYLWRNIQVAGAAGHDSKEDAIAAGDLVRFAVGKKWRKMEATGWRFQSGVLAEPDQRTNALHLQHEPDNGTDHFLKRTRSQVETELEY